MVAARPLLPPITLNANVASEQKELHLVTPAYPAPTGAAGIDIEATFRQHIRQQLKKIGARVNSIDPVAGKPKRFRVLTNARWYMVKHNPFVDLLTVDSFDGGLVLEVPGLLAMIAKFAARPDVYGEAAVGNRYKDVLVKVGVEE